MIIEYVVDVQVGGGDENYYGDGDDPTHAIVVLSPQGLTRIKRLNKAVADLKVWHISEFDYTPVYVIEQEDGVKATTDPKASALFTEDGLQDTLNGMSFAKSFVRVDGQVVNVESDGVNWQGNLKNTSINIETCDLHTEELQENQAVLSYGHPLLLLGKRKLKYKSSMAILQFILKGDVPERFRVQAGQYI
jgi:hypothetical protein